MSDPLLAIPGMMMLGLIAYAAWNERDTLTAIAQLAGVIVLAIGSIVGFLLAARWLVHFLIY